MPDEQQLYNALLQGVDVPGLAGLLNEPEWMRDALCREHRDVSFVGRQDPVRVAAARRVRAGCLVRRECLDYAIADDTQAGVWGGTSYKERRQLRAARREWQRSTRLVG